MARLTARHAAKQLAISKITLLRWEAAGAIPKAPRDHNGFRYYTNVLLAQIRSARKKWSRA